MKQIIGGKAYSTETATLICPLTCNTQNRSDFHLHDSELHKSPKGTFFIAGEGGPMSLWARSLGSNGTSGGSGIVLVSHCEARMHMEAAECGAEAYALAGLEVAEG